MGKKKQTLRTALMNETKGMSKKQKDYFSKKLDDILIPSVKRAGQETRQEIPDKEEGEP